MPHRTGDFQKFAIVLLVLPLLLGCNFSNHKKEKASESPNETIWQYADRADNETGILSYFAAIKSVKAVEQDFPFEKTTASLLIGKDEEETYLLFYIDNGQLLPRLNNETTPSGSRVHDESIPLIVSFDEEPPTEYLFLPPDDGDATTAILPHAEDFVEKLKHASTVSVEAPLNPTTLSPIFTFTTGGLTWKH